jgi:hypothetical protein
MGDVGGSDLERYCGMSLARAGGILIGVKPRSEQDASNLVREWQASGGELVHS